MKIHKIEVESITTHPSVVVSAGQCYIAQCSASGYENYFFFEDAEIRCIFGLFSLLVAGRFCLGAGVAGAG